MIELSRSMTHKWIIDKNVNSKDILAGFAALIKDRKRGFNYDDLISESITKARDAGGSTITIGVRLLQACFYMLGYTTKLEDGRKVFMTSPTTDNIVVPGISESEQAKNYLVNLFCMQYPHPFNWTPQDFQIYFGRLIAKLLLEERLQRRIYIDEFIWFLPFVERVNEAIYEELVSSILEFRSLSYGQKLELFQSVPGYQHLFANVTHEVNYYFLRLFKDFGVFNIYADPTHNEGQLFKFIHSENGYSKTYRTDAYKTRASTSGYVMLSESVRESARKLLDKFSPFSRPLRVDGVEIFNQKDWILNLYQQAPLDYLECINTRVDKKHTVSAVVNEMVRTSKFGSSDGKEFEAALREVFTLFKQTREVEWQSGSGKTDLLCTMESTTSGIYNVNIEAKTRLHALDQINSRRIDNHRMKTGAKFCLVVAPRFARGVAEDIAGHHIVTIQAEILADYCLRSCLNSLDNKADFMPILNIAMENLGTDISDKVMSLIERRYGFVA